MRLWVCGWVSVFGEGRCGDSGINNSNFKRLLFLRDFRLHAFLEKPVFCINKGGINLKMSTTFYPCFLVYSILLHPACSLARIGINVVWQLYMFIKMAILVAQMVLIFLCPIKG